jgi:DNA-binding NarL/FixJ family response regulator
LPVVICPTASELEHQFRDATPELVVLSLADVDNAAIADMLDLLSKLVPKVPVLVLAQADDVDLARTAIRHRAKGFIPNTMGVAIAVEAMRFVLLGECMRRSTVCPQQVSLAPKRRRVPLGSASSLCAFGSRPASPHCADFSPS